MYEGIIKKEMIKFFWKMISYQVIVPKYIQRFGTCFLQKKIIEELMVYSKLYVDSVSRPLYEIENKEKYGYIVYTHFSASAPKGAKPSPLDTCRNILYFFFIKK